MTLGRRGLWPRKIALAMYRFLLSFPTLKAPRTAHLARPRPQASQPPLRSPSPREEALVQLVHPFVRSQVPLLATDDGDIYHIRRIVFYDDRLGGGLIIRGHQAACRPSQEKSHAHAARGTHKIRSRQHRADDSEVRPSGHLIGRSTVLQAIERAAGGQLDETR